MKEKLTDRQQEILTFIEQFKSEFGYPPTLREIGKKFDISSTFGVKRHLDALVKKGFISVENFASRAINLLKSNNPSSLIPAGEEVTRIPIVGRVAAGSPIMAVENREGEIVIDPSFIKKGAESFALKIKGDSMTEAGIFEGDIVIVSRSTEVKTNDIAVAMINGEVTVKTFIKKNDEFLLQPENSKYPPILVSKYDEFSILGKVIGVIRWIN